MVALDLGVRDDDDPGSSVDHAGHVEQAAIDGLDLTIALCRARRT